MPKELSRGGRRGGGGGEADDRRGGDDRKSHDTSFLFVCWKVFRAPCSNTNLLANGNEFVAVTNTEDFIYSLLSLRIILCKHYTKTWVYGLAEETILSYS